MSSRINKTGLLCPLCNREGHLSFHHFIPRKVHRRSHFKKNYTKTELQAGVLICRQCHTGIHKTYDEMQLAKQFSNLQSIKADDKLQTHFKWVAKQRIQ